MMAQEKIDQVRTSASRAGRNSIVQCHLDDGAVVVGSCAETHRDQSGLRLTLCPVDSSRHPHRVRLPRLPTGWKQPVLEQWDETTDEWQHCAEIAELTVDA